jgi:hypothetical protein
MAVKQSFFTLTTTRMLIQAFGCYSIYRLAVRANNMLITHGMAF